MNIFFFLCCVILASIQPALAEWRFNTLTTSKAVTYTNVTIDRIENNNAIVFHPGGIISIPISELPDTALHEIGLPMRQELETKRKQTEEAAALQRQQTEKNREEEGRRKAEVIIQDKETDTMEQVHLFPERYIGKKMIFENCKIGQNFYKSTFYKDFYDISITGRGGRELLNFVVSKDFVEQMAPYLQGGNAWTDCKIEVDMQQWLSTISNSIIGFVRRINIYSVGGEAKYVFRDTNIQKMGILNLNN